MYLTINVQDYHVAIRTNEPMFKDQVVTAGMYFAFVQSNEVFFDLNQGGTLVMFASTEAGGPLPSWLHFDPVSYCFYGVAPYPETLKIQLTGMNQISQEYESAIFTLTVLPNSNPIT